MQVDDALPGPELHPGRLFLEGLEVRELLRDSLDDDRFDGLLQAVADLADQPTHRHLHRFLHDVAQALLKDEVDPGLKLMQDALG